MIKRVPALIIILLFLSENIHSQQTRTIENSISMNYLQINEEMNYGLMFKGPGLVYDLSAGWENNNRILDYSFRFGFTYMETKKVAAGNINLVPAKLTYLFKTSDATSFYIGPQLIVDYNYELYPDLQSGYSFWFTHMSLGISSEYKFNLNQNLFKLKLESTLFGFTSRQEVYEDPYFFDLSLAYIVQYVNQDLTFGSLNNYNHTEIELRWQSKPESKVAFAYNFQYYGYFKEPELTMVNQALKIIFLPKNPKK